TSLGIGIYQTLELLRLMNNGERAQGIVIDINVGIKGGRKAVFQFTTKSGKSVTSRDLFHMMLIRHRRGDTVTVLYDPSNVKTATIDMGFWTWQEPGFLYFGFVFLMGLTLFLRLWESKTPRN
ncbi:MAG: DUF3592 domain-containing protein, partial [Deltaproteobacteria bacterium]|nr:DUF3592 domain-containing protein [Deltaproteobacteria bacterium]